MSEIDGGALRIGVVGATGAVGREVVGVLDRATWRPATMVPLARATTATSHVEYGEERVPVDDVEDEDLEALDAIVLATPAEVAREVGEEAINEGVPVVDVSGALAELAGVPLVVPWINPERLLEDRPVGVSLPSAGALLLGSVLGPLRRAGLEGPVSATVLAPASSWGRDGIDELAGQVRALFNQETPPRKVLGQGLAFDLAPVVGELGADGESTAEARVRADLARLVGLRPEAVQVDVVGVPVFSGMSAQLTVQSPRRVDAALVQRLLADGGVVVPEGASVRELPRPRRVDGEPFAHAGRIRVDEDGHIRAWLVMDNLRTVATAAVAAAAALLRLRQVD